MSAPTSENWERGVDTTHCRHGERMMIWETLTRELYLRVNKRRQDGREVQVDLPDLDVERNICPTGMSAQILQDVLTGESWSAVRSGAGLPGNRMTTRTARCTARAGSGRAYGLGACQREWVCRASRRMREADRQSRRSGGAGRTDAWAQAGKASGRTGRQGKQADGARR